MNSRVIIALDFPSKVEVFQFLDQFQGEKLFVKVGMELFYREGPSIIKEIQELGHQIFLDLKLHDIPNTVESAMRNLGQLGVDMVNVHAAGGKEMMKAAKRGLLEGSKENGKTPLCIAVTQLTSTSDDVLHNELLISKTMEETVVAYATMAKESGLDGVVCSTLEVPSLHNACGADFLAVTPGIRLESNKKDDQVRVATPEIAKKNGCQFIVVGRSITGATNPVETYHTINTTMEA